MYMKKTLLLLALFATIGLQAQITLTQNEMPSIGDVFLQFDDTVPSAANQLVAFETGANHTWNFATLDVHDTTGIHFIDATTTDCT